MEAGHKMLKFNLSSILHSSQIDGLKPRNLITKIRHDYGIAVHFYLVQIKVRY